MSGLRVTCSDGSLPTVTIHDPAGGVWSQMRYAPRSAENGETSVTESASIAWNGTVSEVLDQLAALNRLLDQANYRTERRRGPVIYVEYRPEDSGTWYRSRLQRAVAQPVEEVFDGHMLPNGELHLTVAFTRDPYWEGALTTISVSNPQGSTGAVANTTNGTKSAYLTLGSITGDLPAPLMLTYRNDAPGPDRLQRLIAGMATLSSGIPAASLTLPVTTMTPTGGTSFTDAGYTGGSGRSWSVTSASVATILGYWSLSSALLSAAMGLPFRIVGRYPFIVQTVMQIRYELKFGVTVLWQSGWMTLPAYVELHEGPIIELPPFLPGLPVSMAAIDLHVTARLLVDGAAQTLRIDALHLIPAETTRTYRPSGYGAAQSVSLVDDAIEGYVYTDGWSGGALGNYIAYGDPLLVVPGRTNRLHVLSDNNDGSAPIDRAGLLTLRYRPRRRTL